MWRYILRSATREVAVILVRELFNSGLNKGRNYGRYNDKYRWNNYRYKVKR